MACAAAEFLAPGAAARPLLRWWWPGGAVDADALCAQLRAFAAAGWGGVEIQPFRVGLPHALPAAAAQALHEVFTPRFFQTLAAVMDEAERLGLTVDTTFGSCWPFGGGAAITPALATQEVTLAWTTVQGPATYTGRPRQPLRPQRFGARMEADGSVDAAQALPDDWRQALNSSGRVVAVLALRGGVPSLGPYPGFVPLTLPDPWGQVHAAGWVDAAATLDLTDRLQPDGTLAWEMPPGTWQIVVASRFISDQRITESAGHGPQLVLDHLKREAFDAHAARVGDAALPHCGRHAGKTWRAVFVDSLEIPTDILWTDDFADEFARRRGYPLRPWLPLLLQPGWRNCFQARVGAPLFDDPDAGPRVRTDYRQTVSELMIERLYAPFAQWAQGHGLQARTQAHGAPVDWIAAYGTAHIPETEDLAGGAAPHFLRVARSAAHAHGRRLVSAEAFCWLVEGLAVTPQKVRERADEFFVNGAQQLIGHGAGAPLAGQTDEGDAGAPWYPFADMEIGTWLDPANPLWSMQRPLVDYIARCQTLLQRGRAVVPVAVLAPLELFAFNGAAERLTAPPWHHALQDAGYDWDWINAATLCQSRLDGDALITPGGHRYRAIVLPALPAVRAEVAERLAEVARAGVAVWALDQAPQREEGWLDAAARDQRVQQAMAAVPVAAPSAIGRQLRQAGVAPVVSLDAGHGLQFTLREDGAQRWLFLRNPAAQARTLRLPLADGQGAELWHTWTGRRERLAAAGSGACTVKLPAGGARLLRLAPLDDCLADGLATDAGAAGDRAKAGTPLALPLHGPWQVQARGHGLGHRVIAFDADWPALQDLSLHPDHADFAGQLVYRCTLQLTEADLRPGPLWLDLGQVFDAAQVQVNDATPVIGCEAPFVFDIHQALQPGANRITITVANRPENACRDPARPSGLPLPDRRLTRLPTGLLGPVRCISATAAATRWCLP